MFQRVNDFLNFGYKVREGKKGMGNTPKPTRGNLLPTFPKKNTFGSVVRKQNFDASWQLIIFS